MRVTGERRGNHRASLERGQAVVFVANKRVRARPIDISTSGMGLALPATVEPGTYLRVNFALQTADGRDLWVDADGLVTRSAVESNERFLGIQFSVVEGHVASQIHEYVERQRQLQPRWQQAAPYVERYEASSGNMSPPPGFPGGPTAAPATGEYAPPDERAEPTHAAKTGTEAGSGTYAPAAARSSQPTAHGERQTGLPPKLESLYRDALRQLDADRAKKGR